jgi:hypothetical protein
MYADKINAGLAKGLSFQETFGEEADGDVETVRRTFLLKAFQRRQFALLNHLIAAGYSSEALVTMTMATLDALPLDGEGVRLRQRYLDRRGVVETADGGALAFVTVEGAALRSQTLAGYLAGLRRVGVNAEFNGALCRGLLAVRVEGYECDHGPPDRHADRLARRRQHRQRDRARGSVREYGRAGFARGLQADQ